jgi:hypothetical protein
MMSKSVEVDVNRSEQVDVSKSVHQAMHTAKTINIYHVICDSND